MFMKAMFMKQLEFPVLTEEGNTKKFTQKNSMGKDCKVKTVIDVSLIGDWMIKKTVTDSQWSFFPTASFIAS